MISSFIYLLLLYIFDKPEKPCISAGKFALIFYEKMLFSCSDVSGSTKLVAGKQHKILLPEYRGYIASATEGRR